MQKTKRFSRKSILITLLAALAAIAIVEFFARPTTSDVDETPALQTAKVRTGDLVVAASGAGTIVPAVQVNLAFQTSDVLAGLDVSVGDAVTAGQVLGRLEKNAQAEADFQAFFSPEGVARAELALSDAQIALTEAENGLINFIGLKAWYWEKQLTQAEDTLTGLNQDPNATTEQKAQAQQQAEVALGWRDYWQELNLEKLSYTYKIYENPKKKKGPYQIIYYEVTDQELTLARFNLESARVALQDAQAALEIVQTGPADGLTAPFAALGPQTATLEKARQAVERTRLVAPFDGTITSLNITLGQNVNAAPVMTLSTNQLMARFYLDESDLTKAVVGNPVIVNAEAYPDLPLDGQIVMVEPTLQTVDGSPAVVIWAALADETESALLPGMSVEVESIAGEARGALLVPIQSLHLVASDSYAVYVVHPDGTVELTPVIVGLRDYANAVILGGLNLGDVVSVEP